MRNFFQAIVDRYDAKRSIQPATELQKTFFTALANAIAQGVIEIIRKALKK